MNWVKWKMEDSEGQMTKKGQRALVKAHEGGGLLLFTDKWFHGFLIE